MFGTRALAKKPGVLAELDPARSRVVVLDDNQTSDCRVRAAGLAEQILDALVVHVDEQASSRGHGDGRTASLVGAQRARPRRSVSLAGPNLNARAALGDIW